jgi:uncharacterized protein YdaU (DUF1376 family)
MKRTFLFSALAIGVYYLLRQLLSKEEQPIATPRKKHLTTAFSKAKARAVNAVAK